jgi:hypothetical protein
LPSKRAIFEPITTLLASQVDHDPIEQALRTAQAECED